ncbi:SNF related kinase b [Scleropages formosus]|uniref:SNF-related serine/threonine-protein kinase n=1 Tax=Scleropages formosus TaxID=113540 RepID=A0A8C9WEX9_SCLFO|nr:SNF-related serine/threonine-protein kinase-like [Scleropages formosus]XP_029109189.1 SNF-related serine/threonine-protein kinase-like [Scleropages formosus]XP_029109190.1 SNF-related serine/threonine-protein kinase-like [Scleropages formosus]
MAASKSGYEGKIAGLYDLDRTLGKGHFAVVKLARHVFTGQLVAVKVIDKTKLDAMAAAHLLQEVRCMKLVQHPNVVRLYEVIDTQTKLYLILELGDGGDMYDYILRHEGGVSEEQAKVHFAQIVHAIAYCHRLHVVHRDLKPENVVFFPRQGTVKLTDFGFSNYFQPGTMLMTSCGSLAYSAPEILLGEEYDAPAVDVWSLGVILYMLVCGHVPFQEANDSETLTMIMDCKYSVPPHISQDCKDLISRMLQRDPAGRASLAEIESHPWLWGVDPSPAGRAPAPLTSHRSLSQEEHEAILHAMTSGNIADRDTIQEALEADRYNHITATFYLLAERILREKQEMPGRAQQEDSIWTKSSQQLRPLSAPVDLCERGPRRGPLVVAPSNQVSGGTSCRKMVEVGDKGQRPLLLPPLSWEEKGMGLSVTPVKNICALQQICEEEEEGEEAGEQQATLPTPPLKRGMVGPAEPPPQNITGQAAHQQTRSVMSGRSLGTGVLDSKGTLKESSPRVLDQEESDRSLEEQPCCISDQGVKQQHDAEQRNGGGRKGAGQQETDVHGRDAVKLSAVLGCAKGSDVILGSRNPLKAETRNASDPENAGSGKGGGDVPSNRLTCVVKEQDQTKNDTWPAEPPRSEDESQPRFRSSNVDRASRETPVAECREGDADTPKEHNNNTLPRSKLLGPEQTRARVGSPRTRPRKHSADLGLDGVEARGGAPPPAGPPDPGRPWNPDVEREGGASPERSCQARSQGGPAETGPNPAARVGPAKAKNVNLRERLLQLPFCEKALSFNIQPASKEKLMPFAQYNCCHVL